MIEPPPQVDTFNWIWRKWIAQLVTLIINPDIIEVLDSDMSNSWVNVDSTRGLRYWRDLFGVVHLSGGVKNGTINTTIITLPYIPKHVDGTNTARIFPAVSDSYGGYIDVTNTGALIARTGSNGYVYFDGITYESV